MSANPAIQRNDIFVLNLKSKENLSFMFYLLLCFDIIYLILIGFIFLRFLDIDYIRYSRVKKRETRMHIKYQTYIYVYFFHQLWNNNRCCMKTTTSTQSYTFLRLPNFVQILNYQAPPQTFHLLPINIWNLKVKILERYLSKFILKTMRNKNFKI